MPYGAANRGKNRLQAVKKKNNPKLIASRETWKISSYLKYLDAANWVINETSGRSQVIVLNSFEVQYKF